MGARTLALMDQAEGPDFGRYLLRTNVHLSSFDLLHLLANPVQLVPAPPPGKYINPVLVTWKYKAGATSYTVGGGANQLMINAHGFAPGLGSNSVSTVGFLDQATDCISSIGAGVLATQPAAYIGSAIDIQCDEAAELTLGDGTLDVFIYYFEEVF